MRSLLLFLMSFFLSSCDASMCSNGLIKEIVSPDGKYVASVFERNCGATTPYVNVVSLHRFGVKFYPDDSDNWVFTVHGKSDVRVSWVADNKLKVSYSGTGDQPTKRSKWKNILVSYD